MTERQNKILELIELKNNILSIKSNLDITDQELISIVRLLRDNGYNIEDKYCIEDGHFFSLSDRYIRGNTEITLNEDTKNISFIAMSDTHLLSRYEAKREIDQIYEYVSKENIRYVFHMGDFIHGRDCINGYDFDRSRFEKLLKEYPKDDNIVTFLVLGNHDITPIQKEHYNIENIIKRTRLDIVPIGYNKQDINIGLSTIELCHKKPSIIDYQTIPNLILSGHKHIYKVSSYINSNSIHSIHISVPSVSNIIIGNDNVLQKGFVRLNLVVDQQKFQELNVEQFAFLDKITKIGEYTHQFKKIKR